MTGNPGKNGKPSEIQGKSVPLETVLETEHKQIDAVRKLRQQRSGWKSVAEFPIGGSRLKDVATVLKAPTPGREANDTDKPFWQQDRDHEHLKWRKAIRHAHELNLAGLCFSGGGIRSATFNLGVLQALADLKLLHRIDYLSTVSGGGYIGSWLAAWIKRTGSFSEVQQMLSTNRVQLEDDIESAPIRFLRTYSNYLTPQLGLFSGDTLAMVAVYIRNLLLNQSVIIGLLATLLLVPRAVFAIITWALSKPEAGFILVGVGGCLAVLTMVMVVGSMSSFESNHLATKSTFTSQENVKRNILVPAFAAAVAAGLWFRFTGPQGGGADTAFFAACGAVGYFAIWVLAIRIAPSFIEAKQDDGQADGLIHTEESGKKAQIQRGWQERVQEIAEELCKPFAALLAGGLAGWLYGLLALNSSWWDARSALTFGVPLVAGIVLLAATLHIGLLGTGFHDEKREWWGRLGGWLIAIGIGWLAFFWVALYFPDFIEQNIRILWLPIQSLAVKYLTPAWILTTIGSVLAGNSKASGKPGEKSTTATYLDLLAEVGPYVFIVGLVCWMSWGLNQFPFKGWDLFAELVILGALTFLMSWRVDINQFSMHMFYRNRLVSCYLGASNKERSPNLFTGFDPKDDLALKCFKSPNPEKGATKQLCGNDEDYDGPYPVLNMSLNLVKGKDLAWQERKAESFVMTPHYCGYDVFLEQQYSKMLMDEFKAMKAGKGSKDLDLFAYRPTAEYAFPPPFNGPHLGLAMAISGAAASPNMGYYTSTPVAFLLTVFNVRLGQWLGNPRNRVTSGKPTPKFGLNCLMQELFAGTNDTSDYIYLSDGGHFDNLGLYELVKRRCGLIIVCDAEADPNYGFEGLGNSIKRCRIDLGIDIEIDTKPIVPNKSGMSKQHYAIGKIHYEQADMYAPVGKIIYIKASLTGEEPADVTTHKKRHRTFPHESTADQWFSESQFESYRRLGHAALASSVTGKKEHGSGIVISDVIPILKEFGFEI